MRLDGRLLMSDGQALTSTGPSTNVIDLSQVRWPGAGVPMWAEYVLGAPADDANGDETYDVTLQTDTLELMGLPDVAGSFVIPRGAPAGTVYRILLRLQNNSVDKRYVRTFYTLGGTSPQLTITAHLTHSLRRNWTAYPDAIPAVGG